MLNFVSVLLDVKISKKMAQSTAASVINRHRTQSADQIATSQAHSVTKTANRSFPGHPHLFVESSQSRKTMEGGVRTAKKLEDSL